jgi:hypothetical protein
MPRDEGPLGFCSLSDQFIVPNKQSDETKYNEGMLCDRICMNFWLVIPWSATLAAQVFPHLSYLGKRERSAIIKLSYSRRSLKALIQDWYKYGVETENP